MNKLEVGMYVRTNKGLIGKLISKEKYMEGFRLEYKGQYNKTLWSSLGNDSEVIKASHNIIDLIEVGDYVNGEIVTKVSLDNIECNYIETDYSYNRKGLRNKDIKSIVTKEQFSSMEYKVNE